MNKILKYSLIIIMCLSLLINVWLLFSIAYIDSDWDNAYMQSSIEWCEANNLWIDLVNDLIIELKYYEDSYNEIEWIDRTDCWSMFDAEMGEEQ